MRLGMLGESASVVHVSIWLRKINECASSSLFFIILAADIEVGHVS